MISLAVIIVLFVNVNCECDVDTLRCCISDFMKLITAEEGFQINGRTIHDACRTSLNAATCLETYDDQCSDKKNRDLRETIMETDVVIKGLCSTSTEYDFLKNATCLSLASQDLKDCAAKEQNKTQGSSDDATWKNECCGYRGLKSCAIQLSKDQCKENVAQAVDKIVSSLNGLGYEIACQDDFSTCDNGATMSTFALVPAVFLCSLSIVLLV